MPLYQYIDTNPFDETATWTRATNETSGTLSGGQTAEQTVQETEQSFTYDEFLHYRNSYSFEEIFEESPRSSRRESTERVLAMSNEEETIPMNEFDLIDSLD